MKNLEIPSINFVIDTHQGEPVTPREVVPWISGKGNTSNIGHLHHETGMSGPMQGPLLEELALDLTPPPSRTSEITGTVVFELPVVTKDKPLTAQERLAADRTLETFLEVAKADQAERYERKVRSEENTIIAHSRRPRSGRRFYDFLPFTTLRQEQVDPEFGPAD